MNADKDNFVYLHHILDAIGLIEVYLKDIDYETFSANRMIFDAVARELEIIGEASNRIEKDFQKQYPDIPWRKIISFRNVIIHEYFNLDKPAVWKTCQINLPELKEIVLKILHKK
jgi:uncharacterized protein with HEPN domain